MNYPEHEKLKVIADTSQAIGEFLDWLQAERKISLTEWREWEEEKPQFMATHQGVGSLDDTVMVKRKEYVPIYTSISKLLAEFFKIDLNKIEEEKRAMIKMLRESPGGD